MTLGFSRSVFKISDLNLEGNHPMKNPPNHGICHVTSYDVTSFDVVLWWHARSQDKSGKVVR